MANNKRRARKDMEESGHEYAEESVVPIKLCPQKM